MFSFQPTEGNIEDNLLLSRRKQFKSKKEVDAHVICDSGTIIKKVF